MLLIEKSTVFSNLVFRLSNGFDNYSFLSCSWDLITNSETMKPNYHEIFEQVQQVFGRKFVKIQDLVMELVFGSLKHDIYYKS